MRALVLALVLALSAAPARAADPDHAATEPAASLRAVAPLGATVGDSVVYRSFATNGNLVGMTVTNYGFWGNNFASRSPSLEYPLGTGFEHVVRGGLWIGAHAIDDNGAFVGVVTGTVDGATGQSVTASTEFTPAGNSIDIRSKLENSKFYDPASISELDLHTAFSDQPAKRALNTGEDHRPMKLLVTQWNYAWSFSDYTNILFYHYVIKNQGPPLANVWVGAYNEFASGPKNAYSVWPPSSTAGPGSWFSKKWLQYDDAYRLLREHFCFQLPVPGGCQLATVPYWVGLAFLGTRPGNIADTTDKKITLAAWAYAPGSTIRDEDTERYALMSSGFIQPLIGDSLQPQTGDPVSLQATGPFPVLLPGDSIQVDFAIVGGAEIADIRTHTQFAQRAYDRDYIVPIPPPSPRMRVVPRDGALDLYWDDSPESAVDPTSPIPQDFEGYRVYVGEDRLDLRRVAQFDKATPPNDTTGFNTGFAAVRLATPEIIDGREYQYRYTLGSLRNGFKYFCSVTSYDLGNTEIESLESGLAQNKTLAIPAPGVGERSGQGVTVFPNPYRVEARWDQRTLVRDHYLWFANLPPRCTLRIYTLSGDLIFETDFDGDTYTGQGARGIYDPKRELDVPPPTLSGRMYGWNMITREGQAAATGLYMYSVEDKSGGKRSVGKFLIVKSDRENF